VAKRENVYLTMSLVFGRILNIPAGPSYVSNMLIISVFLCFLFPSLFPQDRCTPRRRKYREPALVKCSTLSSFSTYE
jgi:hypothetical protein